MRLKIEPFIKKYEAWLQQWGPIESETAVVLSKTLPNILSGSVQRSTFSIGHHFLIPYLSVSIVFLYISKMMTNSKGEPVQHLPVINWKNVQQGIKLSGRPEIIFARTQGSFYAANWLILANFDPNFVISEISVNQVRKDLACMVGVLTDFSWPLVQHLFTLLMSILAEFSLSQNDPWDWAAAQGSPYWNCHSLLCTIQYIALE